MVWGAILGLTMAPVLAMATVADKPSVFTVSLTYNGKSLASETVSVVPGKAAPFSITKERTYAALSSIQKGKGVISPGVITTGVTGMLYVYPKYPNVLNLNVSYSWIRKMGSTISDGKTIDLPEIATQNFQDAMVLRKGQSIVLHSIGKDSGGLSVTVSRAK